MRQNMKFVNEIWILCVENYVKYQLLVKRKNILSIYIYVHIKYTLLNTVAVFVHGFTYMNI